MKSLLTGLMSLLPAHRVQTFDDFMSRIHGGRFGEVSVTPCLFVQDMWEFDPLPPHLCRYAFYAEIRAVPWIGRPVTYELHCRSGYGAVDRLPKSERAELLLQTVQLAQRSGEYLARRRFPSTVNLFEQRGGVGDYLWCLHPEAFA